MKGKLLLSSLFLCLILLLFGTLSVSAATANTWTYTTSNGNATITDYTGTSTEVKIPDVINGYPVTAIGSYAFSGNSTMTSVTIPDSVTSIGSRAFSGCTSLTDATIPDSVTSIGYNAFSGCSSLTDVTIGEGVTSIGSSAFYSCTSLNRVDITSLEAWCNIEFGNEYANPLYYAGDLYLNGELVEELIIPEGVTSIGHSAFYYCTSLTGITIGEGVISIGGSAFRDCTALTKINWNAKNVADFVEDNNIFESAGHSGSGITLIFGNQVEHIPAYLADVTDDGYTPYIKAITIGNHVTSIGEKAFYDCKNLNRVDITSLEAWCKIEFGNATANPLCYAGNLYLNGEVVKQLTIPSSVESIGAFAFNGCKNLTVVTIPGNVKTIGQSAFYGCDMTIVTLRNGVTSVGNQAFYNCTNLKKSPYRKASPILVRRHFIIAAAWQALPCPESLRKSNPILFMVVPA